MVRCSVEFDTAQALVTGLNAFRRIIQGNSHKTCIVEIVRCKNMFSQMEEWDGIQELIKYSYCDVKFNVIIKVGKYKIVGEVQFMINFMTEAKKIGHIFYGFVRNEDLYTQLARMIEDFENHDNLEQHKKNLELMIVTQNYQQLVNFVLFGTLKQLLKLRSINFDEYIKLCQDNHWKKGKKLLVDGIKRGQRELGIDVPSDDVKTENKNDTTDEKHEHGKGDVTEESPKSVEKSKTEETAVTTNKASTTTTATTGKATGTASTTGARSSVTLSGMPRAKVALKLYNLMLSYQMDKFEIIIEGIAARQPADNAENKEDTPNKIEKEDAKAEDQGDKVEADKAADKAEEKTTDGTEKGDKTAETGNDGKQAEAAQAAPAAKKEEPKSDLDFVLNHWVHNETGRTLLTGASAGGVNAAVKILLKYGANVDKRDRGGYTSLNRATFNGFTEIVETLLEAGGDPNLFDETSKCTNIWNASYIGNLPIMKLLIKHGFDFKKYANQQDKDGYNPFDMMSQMGYLRCLKYFVSVSEKTNTKLDIYNTKTSHGMNPLLVALNGDFRNIVKYLIDKFDYLNGQKDIINTKSKSGKSPLWFAALNDNLEMVKLFGSHPECDFNSQDNRSHWSPLFAAACKSHWRSVEWLMNQEKCDVNLADNDGETPLLHCARYGQVKSVEILCKCARVDLLKPDNYNNPPMIMACYFGHQKSVQYILNALIKRNNVNSWDELEKANILNEGIINRYMSVCKQHQQSTNERLYSWLLYIRDRCVKTKNFELLQVRLNDFGDTNEKEIRKRFDECQKIFAITGELLDLRSNDVKKEICKTIISMIKNKELLNDQLLMIAARISPQKFENALIESVRDAVCVKDIHDHNSSDSHDVAWFKNCILTSNVLCLESNVNTIANDDDGEQNEVDSKEREEEKKEMIFDRINKGSIATELHKQQVFIRDEINKVAKADGENWENLIYFNIYNRSIDGKLYQSVLRNRVDFKNDMENNGMPIEFENNDLINSYDSNFDGSTEYDNNVYLVNLLIGAHKMNNQFQNDCKKLLSPETLGVDCKFLPAPVKVKQRCMVKAALDYSDREWPYTGMLFSGCRQNFDTVTPVMNVQECTSLICCCCVFLFCLYYIVFDSQHPENTTST